MQFTFPGCHFPSYADAISARQMFSNYGSNFLNEENSGGVEFQRACPQTTLQGVHQIIPLANKPTEVPYSWKDRVMGETVEKNMLISSFIPRVNLIIGKRKTSVKGKEVCEIAKSLESYRQNPDICEGGVAESMQPWFTELLQQFEVIKDIEEPQTHNSVYAGGCLAGFRGDETKGGLLISPSGPNLDIINLHRLSENSSGIIRSEVIGKETAPETIYEVRIQQMHSQKQISLRLETSCLICSVDEENKDRPITVLRKTDVSNPTSVSLSPYIPDECLIATDRRQCFLWTENGCQEVIGGHLPRFKTKDQWCSSYFGAHPRQIVFSDTTVVQTYDLRQHMYEGQDLFALPNKLLNQKERIRQSQGFQKIPFYHFIATDYTLLMVDERFPKHAVLKWDHMLSAPPQYTSILDHMSDSDDCILFVGSQVPSEVHGFRLRFREDKPPQSVSQPWRIDRMKDILRNPTVAENVSHMKALEERFNSSLMGLHTLPWESGHVVFQLDSHGDIFLQSFKEKQYDASLADVETSALTVAKDWVEALESQVKQTPKASRRTVVKDVSCEFKEIQSLRPVCTFCQLCLPSSLDIGESLPNKDVLCSRCMFTVKEGRQLVEAVEKDTIKQCAISCDLLSRSRLVDVGKLPSTSVLSRLLLKQWSKDTDIQNELKEWDQEVLKNRKQRRKTKTEQRKVLKETSSSVGLMEQSLGTRMAKRTKQLHGTSASNTESADHMEGSTLEEIQNIELERDSAEHHGTGDQEEGIQEPCAMGEEEDSPALQDKEFSAAYQEKDNSPSNQETGKSFTRQQTENFPACQESVIERTVSCESPVSNLRNTDTGGDIAQSPSLSMYDSDRSLFSVEETVLPRKRRRRSSGCSSVSSRSDLSLASVTSFPGFLASPKHFKSPRNTKTSASTEGGNQESDDHPRNIKGPESGMYHLPSAGSSCEIFRSQSLFKSPVSASRSQKCQDSSPKSIFSPPLSKVRRKKTYKPGF